MEYELTEDIKKATLEFEETLKKLKEKINSQINQSTLLKLEKAIKILEQLEEDAS